MTSQHWFLPDTPDVLGILRVQVTITLDGLAAFTSWASGEGDGPAASALRDAEDRGDAAKRELLEALRAAFVTPLEPEDLFALSRGIDRILTMAREVVSESEVLGCPPDQEIAEMARLIEASMGQIGEAIAQLGADGDRATVSADAAIAAEKDVDSVYYRGMATLLDTKGRATRIGHRELYRRCARIADVVVDLGERIIYAVVKQS